MYRKGERCSEAIFGVASAADMTGRRLALKNDPHFGADSRWSWITACFSGVVLFMGTATTRIAGIFFFGIIETFGATREQASWPVSLAGTMLLLAGPLIGILCRRFSCRAVLLTCSVMTGVAASACYWAQDVVFIAIVFGLIHGTALSGLYVGANVMVAQHFEKRRTSASSLLFTASGLNTALMSRLVEHFRAEYGVRGAFLLYGAVLLNAFPAAIVLRSPPWLHKPASLSRKEATAASGEKIAEGALLQPLVEENSNIGAGSDISCDSRQQSARDALVTSCTPERHDAASDVINGDSAAAPEIRNKPSFFSLNRTAKQFLTLRFLTHALSFSTVICTMGIFVMIPVDLAKDRGIDPSSSVYILEAFAIGDIVFRALSGLAIDSGVLSLESVMLLGYVLQGAACEWFVWARTLPSMIVAAGIFGSTCGSRMCLQAPALVKDFGIGTLPMMYGGLSFCVGIFLLARPPLIGYYRDDLGDYTGLLHLLAALNALFVFIWMWKLIVSRRQISASAPK